MIKVRNLNLKLNEHKLLDSISLELRPKSALGVLGKSGAGKSLLAKSLLCLVGKNFALSADELSVAGFSPLNLDKNALRTLRTKVGFIFQDARASFHPMFNMGDIFEMHLKEHSKFGKKERKNLAFSWLERLGFDDMELLWHSYTHQLSAGMAMRAQVALALSLGAQILLCDEITSSLDEKNAQNITDIFKELKKEKSLVLISHELDFVRALSDEIIVLERGQITEKANAKDFFSAPKTEYGKELLRLYKDNNAFKSA